MTMFQKGEYIMYSNIGVCQVKDIGAPTEVAVDNSKRMYYTLCPVYQAGIIYIPVDTKVFMRPLLKKEEVMELIERIPEIEEDRVENSNLRILSDRYEASFRTHACEDLIQLIKTIHVKEKAVRQNGRQLGQTDQRYFKRAEELLYGEFAVVLELPLEEVRPYMERVLHQRCEKPEADREG
ncbi:MAG: CarD family transcriptional regulator [Oscillospiraceae bacterium]